MPHPGQRVPDHVDIDHIMFPLMACSTLASSALNRVLARYLCRLDLRLLILPIMFFWINQNPSTYLSSVLDIQIQTIDNACPLPQTMLSTLPQFRQTLHL